MIEKKSLRIGNYVEHFGDIVKIMLIASNENYSCRDSFMINIDGEFGCIYADPEETNPIPLTDVVLMAAGCDKKTCGYGTPYLWNEYLFKNEYHMNFDKQGGGWLFKRSIYGNTIIIAEVEYLHQLQNLIFCLTNEELQINMDELKKAVG